MLTVSSGSPPDAVRVVIDLRPLQQPDAAPVTAHYLRNLLAAYAANPVDGESFVALLRAGLPDPTADLPRLRVVARRRLPPTGLLRSGALTVDPFLLRGAEVGASWRSKARIVYHVAGADLPLASGAPVVATLLDLGPWELPASFQASASARFGHRLRARILRDAAALIVGTPSVAARARRLLHLHSSALQVIPFAATPIDPVATASAARPASRYHVFFARHDARSDARTLFDALKLLRDEPRPDDAPADLEWPPVLVMAAASPADRAELARAADRRDVADLIRYAPYGPPSETAFLLEGARAAVVPAASDSAGLTAIDALSVGTPVVASAVGALPDIVGSAGILVEPGDPKRLARAISATWTDDDLCARLAGAASGSVYTTRTWADVAEATRAVYRATAR